MALNAAKVAGGGGDRIDQKILDAGNYPARIVQILDLGLQAQRPYQGKDKRPAQEISITYELVDTFMLDADGKEMEDKPRWVSETIPLHNLKADKAKSTQRYFAADPNNNFGGDFTKIIDTPVNVALVHNKTADKTYVNVASISAMRLKDAQNCPVLKNKAVVFDLDAPSLEAFNSFPDWIKEKIQKNLNFNGSKLQALLGGAPAPQAAPQEAPVEQVDDSDDKPWD